MVFVPDQAEIFDLAGPVQVFHEAAGLGAPYKLRSVATRPEARTEQGLRFAGLEPLPNRIEPDDLVLVPGGREMREPSAWRRGTGRETVDWLRHAAEGGATVASVCVGAFLLGHAGLLDGKACTTHWKRVVELQQRFPRAHVLADRLYINDGRLITSAGIASGVDMALSIVERDCGARTAAAVAREMVLGVRRAGENEQLSPFLDHRDHLRREVHTVQDWLVEHPHEAYTLEHLAGVASVSVRTLTRTFRAATGLSIKNYATRVRLEHARGLLRDRNLTIDDVAARCGFSDARHLRRLWNDNFGAPPSHARF